MLIVQAVNTTHERAKRGQCGERVLERADGTADYDVLVGVNRRVIWKGSIKNHVRDAGAEVLLRSIADKMARAKMTKNT